MTVPRAPSDKYSHDPLVPIIPARLNAALRRRGLSVKAAAERIGKSQQTLDAIIQSAAKRKCRQSTLDKLSSLLKYPADWLSGRARGLPDTVWTAQSRESGFPYAIDQNLLFHRNPDGTPELPFQRGGLNHDPPAYQLASWDLSERIIEAWKRDISMGNEEAATAWDGLRPYDSTFSEDGDHVRAAVQQLLALKPWAKLFMIDHGPKFHPAFLPPPADSEPTAVSEARKQLVEEFSRMDDFAVAMGEGIGILLEPWLSGSTPLDYVTVTQVMKWVLEGMKSQHQLEQFEAFRRQYSEGAEEGT